jgi:hypothetical protein
MIHPDEILVIEVARPGATGGNVATVDWTTIRTDVDGLLALPAITALGDIPNVSEPAPADGQLLVRLGAGYVLQDPPPTPEWGSIGGTLSDQSDLNTALAGKSDTGHGHTAPSNSRATYAASGSLSSGSRSLTSVSPTLLSGVTYLVEAELLTQQRGTGGASYYRLSLTIAGNTSQSAASRFWCVGGVPDPRVWQHERTIVGTGAAITVSASIAYQAGDPLNVDAGELVVRLRPSG